MNRRRAAGLLGIALVFPFAVAGAGTASPGALDPGFSSFGGRVRTAVGAVGDSAAAVAFTDGKLLAIGQSFNGTDTDFALVRYRPDGSVNGSFGTNGVVTTDFGSGNDSATAVAVRPNGKIIVVGSASNGPNTDFAVARYNPDGSPDTGFSGDGRVTTDFGVGNDAATAVVVQPDGKILVAGYAAGASNPDFALVRYRSDGSLDTSFSDDGLKRVDFGSSDFAYGVALQSNGRIVVAGAAYNGTNYDTAVARLKAGGARDTSFGGNGRRTVDVGNDDFASAVLIQPDGRVVTAGRMDNGTNDDFSILRFKSGGSLDGSFNGTGVRSFDFNGGDDDANAIGFVDTRQDRRRRPGLRRVDDLLRARPAEAGRLARLELRRRRQGVRAELRRRHVQRGERARRPGRRQARRGRLRLPARAASTATSRWSGSARAALPTWRSRASRAASTLRSEAVPTTRTGSRSGPTGGSSPRARATTASTPTSRSRGTSPAGR